jgi:putative oxidoreductase
MLVAGVYTRIAAFALLPFVLGATWAHSGNGWVFTAPNGGWEYPAFLSLAALAVGFLGNGAEGREALANTRRGAQVATHAV